MYLCTDMNRKILRLALPSIVSNITVPLLGLVDTAIVGHMGMARYIGAIAVGSMIFNTTYWLFSFLRMGTGGLTAQAYGREGMCEASTMGLRSILISGVIGMIIIILQYPIFSLVLWFISPENDVLDLVWEYCRICVWGAPASLCLFALNGWFVGMQNTRIPMLISITQNVANILISLVLVYGLGWKIGGVATGTLAAQWAGAIMGLVFFLRMTSRLPKAEGVWDVMALKRFFSVNRDIFLRTVFLVAVNLYFVAAGAKFGTNILAINTLLMQLFLLYSYVMDGFAYATEALSGRYYGAGDYQMLHRAIKGCFKWSFALTVIYTLIYVFGGEAFISLLTDEAEVVECALDYMPWAMLVPFAGLLPFVWDGVFIGMTLTRGMLLATFVGSMVFFAVFFFLSPYIGNHALWLAFDLYLLFRGLSQTWFWNRRNVMNASQRK